MLTRERWWQDYQIGERRQTTGRTITEADVVLHAGQTGDLFPHHMDAEWCATQPFGRRMAHGTLVLSLAVGMTASEINPQAMSYGYDRIRFVRPVHLGDTITTTAEITAKADHKRKRERLGTGGRAGQRGEPARRHSAGPHPPLPGQQAAGHRRGVMSGAVTEDARAVQAVTELAYGRHRLPVHLPDRAVPTVIRQTDLPALPDPAATVRTALDDPVGAPPLAELACGRNSACIVICDTTRPVPNGLFLRPMITELLGAGIAADRITVLVATGLHFANEGAELAEVLGDPWVSQHIRVENHDARDDSRHRWLGHTSTRRTPVAIDATFADADLKIVTGLVEPHFMAGWSGGRKVIAPGVAHQETIRTFHSARFMGDPGAAQCNPDGNPLHEEQVEIVGMLGEVYALNTVVNEDRRLVQLNFGEVVSSHLASVAASAVRVPVPRRYSTIVTSAAGYPLDKTYYQTVKAMVTPLEVLEPGGTLIVASECSEGFGSAGFRDAQQRLSGLGPDAFLRTISRKRLADIDEWQTQMQLKPLRRGRVQLYSTGLAREDRKLTCVEVVEDLAEAIKAGIERSGDPAVAVIPDGPYVVPYLTHH